MKETPVSHHKNLNELPIGVFDSGMGGLTVLQALKKALPHESFLYLGDTARLPYGTKSPDTIAQYVLQNAQVLMAEGIKALVIACNTAAASGLATLQQHYHHLPILGVIDPGVDAAIKTSTRQRFILLATETTIASRSYQNRILNISSDAKIWAQACGLFVPLTEEGWVDNEVAFSVAQHYLAPIQNKLDEYDCAILGCTHFPVLKKVLKRVLSDSIHFVDSAETTASAIVKLLRDENLAFTSNQTTTSAAAPTRTRFMVTDLPERFIRIGQTFLGEPIAKENVEFIDIRRFSP